MIERILNKNDEDVHRRIGVRRHASRTFIRIRISLWFSLLLLSRLRVFLEFLAFSALLVHEIIIL